MEFRFPPIFVVAFPQHGLVAVCGSFDEFGSANLRLYTIEGSLSKSIQAPQLGKEAQFGFVSEQANGRLEAGFGYKIGDRWVEKAGYLSLEDGAVTRVHRAY